MASVGNAIFACVGIRDRRRRRLARPPHPTLIENNRWFHGLLTDGVPVEYKDAKSGETRGGRARLIDFDRPAANDFLAVRQLTVAGAGGKAVRPDLVLYVNGLPLVVIELKDPADAAATLRSTSSGGTRRSRRTCSCRTSCWSPATGY